VLATAEQLTELVGTHSSREAKELELVTAALHLSQPVKVQQQVAMVALYSWSQAAESMEMGVRSPFRLGVLLQWVMVGKSAFSVVVLLVAVFAKGVILFSCVEIPLAQARVPR
jgi:hypothetical protein